MSIPDWKLEKYLTGDLPKKEMESLDALVREDEALVARIRGLKADGAEFLERRPFERLDLPESSGLRLGRFSFGNVGWCRPAAIAFAVLVVASLVSFSWIRLSRSPQVSEPLELAMAEDIRIKGADLRLEVWKKTADGAVRLENMDGAFSGDELQLRYFIPRKCFGLLLNMDGNGVLTVHLGNGNRSAELEAGKMRVLPFAYKLDDAPYFEKFFLITSDKEFFVDENNLDEILNGKDFRTVSVSIKKIARGEK